MSRRLGGPPHCFSSLSKPLLATLLFTLFFSSTAAADCEEGEVLCEATTVIDNGTTVSQTFELGFATENQSIWTPGQTSTNLGVTLVDPATTGWGGSQKHGGISRYCLDDAFNKFFGSTIAGIFKDYFSNPCYEFGAKIDASLSGDMGFSMDVVATNGEVAVQFPVQIEIDYPTNTTFGPGDDIEINTRLQVGDAELHASSPNTSIVPTTSASIKGKGYAKGCIDDCSSTTAYNIDQSYSNTVEIPFQGPGTSLELNPLFSDTSAPSQIFGFALGATGHIGAPLTETSSSSLNPNTLTLTGDGQDEFVDLNIDVDTWLMRFAGVPVNVLGGYTFNGYGAKIGWGVMNANINVEAILKQHNSFTPTFYIDFNFSHTVDYDVMEGGSLMSSGSSAALTITPGQTIVLHIAEDHRGEISVNSTVRQSNEFKTTFRQQQNSSVDVNALSASLTTPKARIFNKRCLPDYLGGYCTSNWDWSATRHDYAPVINQPNLAPVSTEYYVYNPEPWELGGFQTFQLSAFVLVPNTPPEIAVPEALIVEADTLGGSTPDNQSILAFLQSATAFDYEDGVLSVSHTSLPDLLEVGQTYSVSFSAVDSYNQGVSGNSSVTIVDTTAPILMLDDLVVVAERPTGTMIPDESNQISDWLASLLVSDIADGAPTLTDSVPESLDLGFNAFSFTATDFSGNETSIQVEVYVKAPFSLFAYNSIKIGRNTSIESGMVAIPAATPGPWLDKNAQLTIDRHGLAGYSSEVFSPSIDLDRDALINTAFFAQFFGKGTILEDNPFFPGIYFSLDSLPGFAAGIEDVRVNCKNKGEACANSGLVLSAGAYGVMDIGKGKKHQSSVVYLAGGTYSFSEIQMDENSSLIALAPSLILVENRIETGKNSQIAQQTNETGEENELVIMVAGLDDFGKSGKSEKSNKSTKSEKSEKSNNEKLRIKKFAVSIGHDSLLEATVFAANGSISLQRNSTLIGALIGENLEIGREVLINFDGDI